MVTIITWVVVITQTVSSFSIISMHILLARKLKESKKTMRKFKSNNDSDVLLVVQLFVITASNILCWFPANGIYLAAMFLSTYPIDLIVWTSVICLPLNSVMNPSVFIITSVRKFIKSKMKPTNMVENEIP